MPGAKHLVPKAGLYSKGYSSPAYRKVNRKHFFEANRQFKSRSLS